MKKTQLTHTITAADVYTTKREQLAGQKNENGSKSLWVRVTIDNSGITTKFVVERNNVEVYQSVHLPLAIKHYNNMVVPTIFKI